MKRFAMPGLGLVATAWLAAGCAAGPAATPSPSHRPAHSPAPSANPTPAPPAGPFGVVLTNADRSGSTYDILLVDVNAHVVAHATAFLPLLKPNQSVDLPLVSASSTRVYYRNGDTDIDSLQPNGQTAVARHVPEGSSAEIGFAVSPDDQRIAIVAIKEASDPSKDAGNGYVEDLSGSTNHVDLFNNTGADAFRWPVGWHGQSLVDAVGQCGGPSYYGPPGGAASRGCAYHVIDASTGARRATVCETPANAGAGSDYYSTFGDPTAAGTSCFESQGQYGTQSGQTNTVMSVDWGGAEHDFLSQSKATCCIDPQPYGCYLAPSGSQMACITPSSQATELLLQDGKTQNLGRRYTIQGWIDGTHLLVTVDASTLGVLTTSNGLLATLALPNADKVGLGASFPGGF